MFVDVLLNVFSWEVLLALVGGVTAGIAIGAMPGLTSTMGIALLMPLTFRFEPAVGMMLLIGEFVGGIYGGSITAILINTPGTSSAAATTLDGYPMTKRGEAARALGISTIASSTGGMISALMLIFIAPTLASMALEFSAPETFALAFFGISIISSISGKSLVKGLLAGLLGLMLSLIGMDNISGFSRFSFNTIFLMNGLSFIPVLVGLFAMSQCLLSVEQLYNDNTIDAKNLKRAKISLKDFLKILPTTIRSGITGTLIGIIPGAGGDISAFVSYDIEKRFSKHPEKFGTGIPEGIAAPEASNNGTTGGALIPLLTLGIPGDSNTAVMLGALMMHNLVPGPQLFVEHELTVKTLFAGLFIANLVMLVLGLSNVKNFVKIVNIPKKVLTPIVMVLCVIGSFAINSNFNDVIVMFVFGVIGFFLCKGGFPLSPIVLALILGPMAEGNLRRSLVMSHGSYSIFFTRPIAAVFIFISIISLFWPIVKSLRQEHAKRKEGR
ncbi:MAG: tripartite tricarboxylate transporter permease [Sphaerochaetaceae bacterium]|nr:tripartite tricarboxylate transporter permease [Sphaerochaetaceae bacterium]